MSAKIKRGLGRGIEALFEDSGEKSGTNSRVNNIFDTLPIEQIKPNSLQPRKTFDKELLKISISPSMILSIMKKPV